MVKAQVKGSRFQHERAQRKLRLRRMTMFRRAHIVGLACAMLSIAAISASAQVEKVEMHTVGISCGSCAAISEVYLRRLDGVAKLSISKSGEKVVVFYKPEARFRPEELREALGKTGVKVTQFRVSARGQVLEEGGKRFLLAGNDKFLLLRSPYAPPVGPVSLEATVDVAARPMQLDVISFTQPTS
jgi:hypothetical protein